MDAMLRADIDASIAQYALPAFVNGMHMAIETSMRLLARLLSCESFFHFRDTAAPQKRRGRYATIQLFVPIGHLVRVGRKFLDRHVHPRWRKLLPCEICVD